MVLLRQVIGETLRTHRRAQRRTLREVSAAARVSLGYLSEVERGHKEPSSELLSAICEALDVPMSNVLGDVTDEVAREEQVARLAAEAAPLSRVSRLSDHRKVAELSIPQEDAEAGAQADSALSPPVSLAAARARRAHRHDSARPGPKASVAA